MPSYVGMFRSGPKLKKFLECFKENQEMANEEFEEYAKKNNLVFIRSYLSQAEKEEIKENRTPSVTQQRFVIQKIKAKEKLDRPEYIRTLEYLIGIGTIIKTKKGFITYG